jgi:two-component system cell cycle sensor histidine kinase/response regulator CckA
VSRPLRVLLVEDCETDAKLTLRELRRSGREVASERVETAEAMRDALRQGEWDLVISDWALPQFSGTAALETLREAQLDIPFILVSGTIGEETAVEAMRAGARDFVLKDRLARLGPAVERELREAEDRASRRRAEQALRRSELRFDRLFDSGLIGVVVADLDGRVEDGNDAYLSMIGYTRRDVQAGDVRWTSIAPASMSLADGRHGIELVTNGRLPPLELELTRKDGSTLATQCGVAMLDESKVVAFVVDLTERKQAEAALLRSEMELRHAQKMEAVGRLAGGIAHDFNNLLSVMLACSELGLFEVDESHPAGQQLVEIRAAAQRAAVLTRQLLAFSRRQILQPRAIDLDEVVRGTEQLLRRLIGEDIELELRLAGELPAVRLDPGQIGQVLMNLVVNARDAMPQGGTLLLETGTVQLDEAYTRQHPRASPGTYVMLGVADTGCGMDAETRERAFEPFYTTKSMDRGTGLGLSTVLGIVEQSGGSIVLESEPGHGARFRMYFRPLPPEATHQAASEATVGGAMAPGTETILLVEDDEAVRSMIRTVLTRLGYTVLVAAHGEEAQYLFAQHAAAIGLLLADVVMPRMSGRQLAERLRVLRPALRVLYISGYNDDAVLRHGLLANEVALLLKPFTPHALAAKVREVLDAAAPAG